MKLPVAGRYIICHDVSEDMSTRLLLAHPLGRRPNHDAELCFIVELFCDPWINVIVRTRYTGGLLVEPELLRRLLNSQLGCLLHMLFKIHSYRKIFSRPEWR